MSAPKPDPQRVRQAIDTYVRLAYDGPPPVNVRSLLSILGAWGGDFYECPIFVSDLNKPPTRYSARLGNKHYPHMKLVLQLAPNGDQWLFRADAHDRHCCPPQSSPEYNDFCSLIQKNQAIVEQIEAAWAEQGLPTFKTYLREDLMRRARAAPGVASSGAPSAASGEAPAGPSKP